MSRGVQEVRTQDSKEPKLELEMEQGCGKGDTAAELGARCHCHSSHSSQLVPGTSLGGRCRHVQFTGEETEPQTGLDGQVCRIWSPTARVHTPLSHHKLCDPEKEDEPLCALGSRKGDHHNNEMHLTGSV